MYWRFTPTKVEAITMLDALNNGISLPGVEVSIHRGHHVFGDLTPSELIDLAINNSFNNCRDKDYKTRYFYTPMKRLTKNLRNCNRTIEKFNDQTGNFECVGTWKLKETVPVRIYDPDTRALIGESWSFTYSPTIKRDEDDEWLMEAYCLAGDVVVDKHPDSDFFAICHISQVPLQKYINEPKNLPEFGSGNGNYEVPG